MTRKNKRKKSLVPLRLQIPLAVVLGILFLLLLNARLKGRRDAGGIPLPAVEEKAAAADIATVDCDRRITSLIDKISAEAPSDQREEEPLPELAGDPFVKPERTARRRALNGLNPLCGEDNEVERSREAFMSSLVLQATLIDGDMNLALINDKLLAQSDTIGPFNIVKIGERAALLSDESGTVLLKMKGDDTL